MKIWYRAFFLLNFFAAGAAYANSVNVQVYRSPFNLNYGLLESAINDGLPWDEKAAPPKVFSSLDYHYAQDPLVEINRTTNTRVRTIVDYIHTAEFSIGYFLNKSTSIYFQAPTHVSALPGQSNHFDFGDTRLAAKIDLNEQTEGALAFSLVPELVFPTGNKDRFLSDDSLSPGLLLAAEKDFGAFRLLGNAGYRHAGNASIGGINYKDRFPLGVGVALPIARKLALNGEVNGFLSSPIAQQQNPSEFYLGLNYHPKKYLAAIFGGSIGAFEGEGSLNYRLQAAIRMYFAPDQQEQVAETYVAPEEPSKPAPAPAPTPRSPTPRARMVENKIEILEEIQFEHNSDKLLESSKLVLDEVAEIIFRNLDSIKTVEIEGHTSLPGSESYNDKLSKRRANSVVAYLTKVSKVNRKLLIPKGYGEQRPKFLPGKATPEELERNRRVEFKINKKKK